MALFLRLFQIVRTVSLDVNVGLETFDYAVFAGHKTLYGPTGISGFVMNSNADFPAILFGGTGFDSANQEMPKTLPQKYEGGTLNIAGVAGLHAALKWILETGTNRIWHKEQEHRKRLLEILSNYDFIHPVGADGKSKYVGIVSCLVIFFQTEIDEFNFHWIEPPS